MVRAIVLVIVLGGTGERLDWTKQVAKQLKQIQGVKEVFGVLGRFDLVAIVEVGSLEELTSLVADKMRSVPGIQSSETLTVAF
ncbi:MAG: Lrp/AsnC ligand binding domain-containing protein [Candidatus Bathyarchaeia archaeon]|jgi:DNA-binding Lrp family transcriptional regulator